MYPTLPFHAIRTLSLISALIVSGILIFFCYQLKVDGYKLPWTFLIVSSVYRKEPSERVYAHTA